MAIARPRSLALPTSPASGTVTPPALPLPPAWADGAPLPPTSDPAPSRSTLPAGRLRRCTFRRIDKVAAPPQRADVPTYEVMCLYFDRESPIALGDIEDARPVCEACRATGIFRPDEE